MTNIIVSKLLLSTTKNNESYKLFIILKLIILLIISCSNYTIILTDIQASQYINMHDKFCLACINGDISFVKWALSSQNTVDIDIHYRHERAFRTACAENQLDIVKYLLELDGDRYIDIHALNDLGFHWAVHSKKKDVAILLLSLTGDRRISLQTCESVLDQAVDKGDIPTIKFLLSIQDDRKIDIHYNDDFIFHTACYSACYSDRPDIIEYLLSLKEEYYIHDIQVLTEGFYIVADNLSLVKLFLNLEENRRIDWSTIDTTKLNNQVKQYMIQHDYITLSFLDIVLSNNYKTVRKHPLHRCIISYEQIHNNEEFVECNVNPEHVLSLHAFKKYNKPNCPVCISNKITDCVYINQ